SLVLPGELFGVCVLVAVPPKSSAVPLVSFQSTRLCAILAGQNPFCGHRQMSVNNKKSSAEEMNLEPGPILADEESPAQEMQPPILADEESPAQEMPPPILADEDSPAQEMQPCTLPSDPCMDQEISMQEVHPAKGPSCSLSVLGTQCTSSPLLEQPSAELVDDDLTPLPCAQPLSTGGVGHPPSSPDTPCSRRSTLHPSPVPSSVWPSALGPVLAGENSSDIEHNEGTERKRKRDDDGDGEERRTKG
ncbi:hypothetical protein AALO_G00209590, partial [Alosa alosa]